MVKITYKLENRDVELIKLLQ